VSATYVPTPGTRVRVTAVHQNCVNYPCANDAAVGDEIKVSSAHACHPESDYGPGWVLVNYLVCRVEPAEAP